ncbi:hypothetical protein HZS_4535 [Henneguya salminicola]|nr:hypothetical protein HZS_4535 [Henneguya salminicola]
MFWHLCTLEEKIGGENIVVDLDDNLLFKLKYSVGIRLRSGISRTMFCMLLYCRISTLTRLLGHACGLLTMDLRNIDTVIVW